MYDWTITSINASIPERYARWLLICRSTTDPTYVAYFACGGPPKTTLVELVRIAGTR